MTSLEATTQRVASLSFSIIRLAAMRLKLFNIRTPSRMLNTIRQAIDKRFAFQVLIRFLPLALLVFAASIYLYQTEKNKELITTSTNERAAVDLGKGSIDHMLEYVYSDLAFIAHDDALKRLLENPEPEVVRNFSQDMLNFSASHPVYDQIRWIDETGMERIRVNLNGGHPSLAPKERLQDKQDRYYFADAIQLEPDEVYVSPFDLNVENGNIDIPYKPILRIGTPITDRRGNRRGIVLFNYLGQHLINRFKASTVASGDHTMLLNRDGYWLNSPRPEDEWGFMLKRDDLTLAKTHPAAWQRISNEIKGQFLDADGLWTFDTAYPLSARQKINAGNAVLLPGHSRLPVQDYQWKVVLHLVPARLFAKTDALRPNIVGVATFLLGLLLIGSWKLARAHVRKLAETDLRIAATAFQSQAGMMVTDAHNMILRVNRSFTQITGYTAEEVLGKNPRIFSSGRQDANFYAEMWSSINQGGAWEGEIWNRRKNGEVYPLYLTATAVKGVNGVVTNYVASLADITQRKTAEKEIQYLAFYDQLTNLPNRRLLLDRLQQALTSCARGNREGALLFIDLDNFKTLNDTLGHDFGDLLLQQVAQRLVSCLRECDTVARLGGDEFVVMLEDLSEHALDAAAQAESIAHKILATLNQPYQLASHEHRSTSSIGVVLFKDHDLRIEEMLKQADIAMYHAKKSGRNMLRFFDPQMQESINARVALEAAMRLALKENLFELYFQLQTTHDNQPVGAEVLIRWQHPEFGLLSPSDFIPLAEETGMILPIGKWILETTCAQLNAWQHDARTRPLSLSVNVSAKQFHQTNFVAQVKAIIERHAINPMKLKLELTESILLDDIEDTIASMTILKDIGVQFSLDDFGTGYSSLQYIKKLPLSQLKIDESFVRDIAVDSSDQAIVSTIIAMAKSLNLNVIAEGVETEEQRQLLLSSGCSHFQGYLFGKPVPPDQFEAQLSAAEDF